MSDLLCKNCGKILDFKFGKIVICNSCSCKQTVLESKNMTLINNYNDAYKALRENDFSLSFKLFKKLHEDFILESEFTLGLLLSKYELFYTKDGLESLKDIDYSLINDELYNNLLNTNNVYLKKYYYNLFNNLINKDESLKKINEINYKDVYYNNTLEALNNKNYKKALELTVLKLNDNTLSNDEAIKYQNIRKEIMYLKAIDSYNDYKNNSNNKDIHKIRESFIYLDNYKDSLEIIDEIDLIINDINNEKIYNECMDIKDSIYKDFNLYSFNLLIEKLDSLDEYKDSYFIKSTLLKDKDKLIDEYNKNIKKKKIINISLTITLIALIILYIILCIVI